MLLDPAQREVADITGRSAAACRQLASTARRRVRGARPPARPPARQADVIRAFRHDWEAKDISGIWVGRNPEKLRQWD